MAFAVYPLVNKIGDETLHTMSTEYDAVIVGSGPNGLAAAIRLAQEKKSVLVVEGRDSLGGGTRTAELTLPGFRHDVCSAVHPMGLASPFLRSLPLAEHGLEWIDPELPLAHPLEGGEAAILARSVEETAEQFDTKSAAAYRRLFGSIVPGCQELVSDLLAAPRLPKHPLRVARFGLRTLPSAQFASQRWFSDEKAQALLAGNAAHSILPLDRPLATNAIGLMLMMVGHGVGWPVAKGGSQKIADTMVSYLKSLGGKVETGRWVKSIDELPSARAYLFDTAPQGMDQIAGSRLPDSYRKRLRRFRHGPGVFKIDYALSEPVPWTNPDCRKAGTVHVGGTLHEIARSEREMWEGTHCDEPFVLTSQPTVCDPSRAPAGKHVFWAYCHVPAGSDLDQTDAIEQQIERFAPGFRDCILERHTMTCRDYEAYNPNLIGGDIAGGVSDWRQIFTRPVVSLRPHATPSPEIFLCSSSTPPGGGVHGMCGYWAAEAVLRKLS